MKVPKTPAWPTTFCRTCHFCEFTGRGVKNGAEIDVGICRGAPPRLAPSGAGAFPPVGLDSDWCGEHPGFKPPPKGKRNA